MANKLIINERRQLGWRRRILSDVATLGLWLGWIYLWLPVFRKLIEEHRHHLQLEPMAIGVLDTIAPISPWHAAIALVGTSALLLLWRLLPTRQVTHAHTVESLDDYARYFGIDADVIRRAQASRVCIVHHDDHGVIDGIEIVS